MLAETADQVRRAFPKVTLRLTTAWSHPLLEHVRSGALDLALVYGPADTRLDATTTSQCIGTLSLVFVAPGARRRARVRALTEVATESWV